MIKADIHMHSQYSGDSNEPTENMIQSAIQKGLNTICITEHMDIDYPVSPSTPEGLFTLDTDRYYPHLIELKNKYTDSIEVLLGVELGLQPHLASYHAEYVQKYPFDFVIGSEHTTNRKDPYYPSFYEGRSEYDAYSEYFQDIVTNLDFFRDIDTLGHLDYVVRYGPNANKNFTYSLYGDYIDAVLRILVDNGIGLEVNSSGYKYGLGAPNPCKDILLRYKEFGGSIITVGSDAHDAARIGADFDKVKSLLEECGFKYYCVFRSRKPEYIPLL